MHTTRLATGLAVLLVATQAAAQARGSGSGFGAATAPVTKSAGPPIEAPYLSAEDLPVTPRHGMMGAPGAAMDQLGPSRLGPHGERGLVPEYGEAPPEMGGAVDMGESYGVWRSGDRVRSASSADVRAARQQQAPDLEWVKAGEAR